MKRLNLLIILFVFSQCHTTVIKFKNSQLFEKTEPTKTLQTQQTSIVFGYYEITESVKSKCEKDKTSAVVIHRDWKDKLIYIFIGGMYSRKSVSVMCD